MYWDQISFSLLLMTFVMISFIKTLDKFRFNLKKKTITSKLDKLTRDDLIDLILSKCIIEEDESNTSWTKTYKRFKVIANYWIAVNSAFLLCGSLAESYLYGVRIIGNIISIVLGFIYAFVIVHPFMHSLDEDIKTPYQYFERRYRNRKYVRAITAAAAMLFYFLFLTLYLWGCALLLTTLIPQVPLWLSSVIVGSYSIIGTLIGGLTQSTKTNVLQFCVLITGLIMTLTFTVKNHKKYSPSEIWSIAVENNRTTFFDTRADFTTRYTIINQCLSLSIPWTCVHSLFLPNFIRYRNIRSRTKSRFLMISNLPFMVIVNFILLFSGGVLVFIYFYGCDPIYSKKIENKNQVGAYWIYLVLSEYVPSYTGILFASVLGYSVVQHSNGMALCSNSIIQEILKPIIFDNFKKLKQNSTIIKNTKLFISFMLGCLSILVSIGMAYVRNTALSLFFVFNNSINSPIIGLFFLAAFNPYSNDVGAMLAFVTNLGINFWLASGAVLASRLKSQEFPPDTFECPVNSTQTKEDYYPTNPSLAYLYSVSSIWYCLFSFMYILLFGSLFSFVYSLCRFRRLDADHDYTEQRKNYLYIYRLFKMNRVTDKKQEQVQMTSF